MRRRFGLFLLVPMLVSGCIGSDDTARENGRASDVNRETTSGSEGGPSERGAYTTADAWEGAVDCVSGDKEGAPPVWSDVEWCELLSRPDHPAVHLFTVDQGLRTIVATLSWEQQQTGTFFGNGLRFMIREPEGRTLQAVEDLESPIQIRVEANDVESSADLEFVVTARHFAVVVDQPFHVGWTLFYGEPAPADFSG